MRTVNIIFEDKEFKRLQQKKGKLKWRKFILSLLENRGKTRGEKCLDAGNVVR